MGRVDSHTLLMPRGCEESLTLYVYDTPILISLRCRDPTWPIQGGQTTMRRMLEVTKYAVLPLKAASVNPGLRQQANITVIRGDVLLVSFAAVL